MVSIYVSYAWKEEEQNRLVDKLENACASSKTHVLRAGSNCCVTRPASAMAIRSGSSWTRSAPVGMSCWCYVVLVLSEAYFKSPYCMYELLRIYNNQGFRKRVNPIVLSGTRFHDPIDRIPYIEYWETKTAELEAGLKRLKDSKHTLKSREILDGYDKFRMLMDELLSILADMHTPPEEVHVDTDFAALLERIAPDTGNGDGGPGPTREADEDFVRKVESEVQGRK